jgi:hypothetical protein
MGTSDIFDELVEGEWRGLLEWVASERSESLNLEFKGRRLGAPADQLEAQDKNVLGRAMSGFANVDGGVLVFGLDTYKAGKGDPNRLARTQTTYLPDAEAFKRALQRHYRDVTAPAIPGVKIESIVDPSANPCGVVALLVPSSEARPHRTSAQLSSEVNNRYYMRTDTDTAPMPHEMLAALFGRTPRPRLRLVVRWSEANKPPQLFFYLRNEGPGTAREPIVRLMTEPNQFEFILAKYKNRSSLGIFTVLVPDVVKTLYPGFEEYLGAATVRRTVEGKARTVRIRGAVFAVDAQPVTLDEDVVFVPEESKVLPTDVD